MNYGQLRPGGQIGRRTWRHHTAPARPRVTNLVRIKRAGLTPQPCRGFRIPVLPSPSAAAHKARFHTGQVSSTSPAGNPLSGDLHLRQRLCRGIPTGRTHQDSARNPAGSVRARHRPSAPVAWLCRCTRDCHARHARASGRAGTQRTHLCSQARAPMRERGVVQR